MFAVWLLGFSLNSDFEASAGEAQVLHGYKGKFPITVVLKLTSLSEQQNSAEGMLIVRADSPLRQYLRDNKEQIRIRLFEDLTTNTVFNVASEIFDGNVPESRGGSLESEPMKFNFPLHRDVSPYPFDDYFGFLQIDVGNEKGHSYPFDIEVQKGFAGRSLNVEGHPEALVVVLKRPRLQQLFVLLSSGVFLIVTSVIGLRLFKTEVSEKPLDQLLAVGGFLLSAASFRELSGVSRVASFTVLEGVILGFPLMILAGGFVFLAVRKADRLRGSAEK